MSVTYQRELFSSVIDEAMPLLVLNWDEIETHKHIPLDVDVETYCKLQDADLLRIFTVRKDEILIGYACFVVATSMHHRGSKQARQDVVFVLPEYRRANIGIGLIKFCDEQLQAEGVQMVYQFVKRTRDFSAVLAHLGYEQIETVHAKRLN